MYRKWFCTCTGKPVEITYEEPVEGEEDMGLEGEPTCYRCGASQSSDPKHTISFRDYEGWED